MLLTKRQNPLQVTDDPLLHSKLPARLQHRPGMRILRPPDMHDVRLEVCKNPQEVRHHLPAGSIVLQHVILARVKGIVADAVMDTVMATGCIADRERQRDLAIISFTKFRQKPVHPPAEDRPPNLKRIAEVRQDDIAEPEHAHH